jgi:hypothetical protein
MSHYALKNIRLFIPYIEALLVYGILLIMLIINVNISPNEKYFDPILPCIAKYINKVEVKIETPLKGKVTNFKKEIETSKKEIETQWKNIWENRNKINKSVKYKYIKYHIIIYIQRSEVKYLLYHAIIFVGVIFSLYYGIHGIIFALFGLLTALYLIYFPDFKSFSSEAWIRSILSIILFFIVGNNREITSRNSKELQRSNNLLLQRNKELTVNLVSLDCSHKKYLTEVYCRVDRPKYLFHELYSLLDNIIDEEELFKKIFSALFRYNFVEGGIVYKKEEGPSPAYTALLRYGVSSTTNFPEKIDKKEHPTWLKMVLNSGHIITPKIENNQFIIAIPITENPWENEQNFIIVIERIRYTMQTANTKFSLKIMSILLRYIMERRLFLLSENIFDYSVVKGTVIYKPGVAEKLLAIRLKTLKKAEIPYQLAFLSLQEEASISFEELLSQDNLAEIGKCIDKNFREADEKFFIGKKLFVLFPFAESFQPIQEKFKVCRYLMKLKKVSSEDTHHFMVNNNFNNMGSC